MLYNKGMKERNGEKPVGRASSSFFVKALLLVACVAVLSICVLYGVSRYIKKDAEPTFEVITATIIPSATPTIEPTYSPVPQSTEEPEENVSIYVSEHFTLMLGDEYPAVASLQIRLLELGYMDYDEPSNTFNEATKSAVMLFQRAQDSEMTGIADSTLQDLLFSEQAPAYQVKLTDSGADIRSIQSRLSELGYYKARTTGYFGPNTEASVLSFQMQNGLTASGVVSYDDWQLLYSTEVLPAVIIEEITPEPTPKPTAKSTPKTTSGSGKTTPKPTGTASNGDDDKPTPTPKPTSSGSGHGSYSKSPSGLIECAKDQMGKSYVWGDEGPDTVDCSGLVYYCLRSCGVSTSRVSAKSFSQKSGWGLVSSIEELQEGDLVFFKSDTSDSVNHTGIYIGGGRFVHASSSKGEVVRSSFSSDSTKYWNRNFVCGRRVFG